MRVEFLYNRIEEIPQKDLEILLETGPRGGILSHYNKGETYTVYGLIFVSGELMFLLDASQLCPEWESSRLFKVVDARVSKYWILSNYISTTGDLVQMLVFPEFLKENFYDHILEEDDDDVINTYLAIKRKMNEEFVAEESDEEFIKRWVHDAV